MLFELSPGSSSPVREVFDARLSARALAPASPKEQPVAQDAAADCCPTDVTHSIAGLLRSSAAVFNHMEHGRCRSKQCAG